MPVDFELERLSVNHFRGVRRLEYEFPKASMTCVIGGNNAGKSTMLDAVAFALAGPSFYNYTLGACDFHRSSDGSEAEAFEINVRFRADDQLRLAAVRGGIGDPESVHGTRVQGKRERSGRLTHDVKLIGHDGKPIQLRSGVPLKGATQERWKEHELSFRVRSARWQDISEHRPEVWLLRPDNLYRSLYEWKTGPLQRLAKMLSQRFFVDQWALEFDGKPRVMPRAIGRAHAFLSAAVQEFPFWRNELRPRLEQALSGYIGRQARIELRPAVESVETWLAEQLVTSFAADAGGAVTPLDKMGHGWQSLVRLAALEVLSQFQEAVAAKVVLLFEEPETYLHPHLARKLRVVLERLAASGWTVVVSTHSPNLVSFAGSSSVLRLNRTGDEVSVTTLRSTEVAGAAKFQERLDERGAHEMLFASQIVLCEGQDDVFALRTQLARRDVDLDGLGVSIVRTGDVHQVLAFARMAEALGIPWFALTDEDRREDGQVNPATAAVRASIAELAKGPNACGCWPGSLEQCFRIPQGKATPDRVLELTSDEVKVDEKFPDYFATCELVRLWMLGRV